jgi:hypothetical protein
VTTHHGPIRLDVLARALDARQLGYVEAASRGGGADGLVDVTIRIEMTGLQLGAVIDAIETTAAGFPDPTAPGNPDMTAPGKPGAPTTRESEPWKSPSY